nr:flagellar hook capping FlgD N-terminal domain-containing protein [uncultured Schaedlerella sp.]
MAVNLNSDVAKGLYNANLTTQAEAKSDKSTLSTDDFWTLIAAELKYQDMSNPMDNAAMMEQITQMSNMSTMNSMATAIANFSTVINNLSSVTLTTYSTGLLGREVTVVTKTDEEGKVVETKKGIVTGVDLTGATSVYVDGKKYELSSIMAIGDVPKVDTDDKTDSTDKTEDTDDKTDSTDKTEGTDDKTQDSKK